MIAVLPGPGVGLMALAILCLFGIYFESRLIWRAICRIVLGTILALHLVLAITQREWILLIIPAIIIIA
jgi:hypothetical protein